MDIAEKMAADIAMAMNGGEWKDGKWYAEGHRQAWIKAVKPYSDEIERLRETLKGLLQCPAIADGNHNEPAWYDPETAMAEKKARAALKEGE